MKLAVKPTIATSETNWRARRAVKVTPRAPSWGDWKRIFKGIPALKSVMSESLGRDELSTVRVGSRGRGNGIEAGGVEEGMVKDWEVPKPSTQLDQDKEKRMLSAGGINR